MSKKTDKNVKRNVANPKKNDAHNIKVFSSFENKDVIIKEARHNKIEIIIEIRNFVLFIVWCLFIID